MSSAPEAHAGPEPVAHRVAAIRRRLNLIATVGFCALIALPTVDQLARPASARDARLENREPAGLPPVPRSVREAARWPGNFDKYYSDSFGARDWLLGARNEVLLRAQLAPNAVVDIGPTGWLFYRDDQEFESHRGVRWLTGAEMDRWILALQDRKDRLARRGARFLFAIAPDKETIYPEMRPANWEPVGPTMADRFLAEVAARTDVEVVDLRPALIAEKAFDRPELDDFVYYPRGTHWTSRGALAATNAILDAIRRTLPDLRPLDRTAFTPHAVSPRDEDSWARFLYTPWRLRPSFRMHPTNGWTVGLFDGPTEADHVSITNNPDRTLPSVLFQHDSFGVFVHPFLLERSRRLRAEWRSRVNEAIVELDHPDIVLMVKAERMLVYPPEKDIRGSESDARREFGPQSLRWSLRSANPPPIVHGDAQLGADGSWTMSAWSDRLEVETGGALGPEDLAILHLDVVAPREGVLELWSSQEGQLGWSKERRVVVGLVRGRNDRSIALPFSDHGGKLMVRLGPKGDWRIRTFEFHVFKR